MESASEAVPYELVARDSRSGHDEPTITAYRSLGSWREHWSSMHNKSCPAPPCPEPDLSGRMLIEITAGGTWTGMATLEVTAVQQRHGGLNVLATLDYPTGPCTDDIGNPFVVLTTPVFDSPVVLDLSVLHGIVRTAPPVTP